VQHSPRNPPEPARHQSAAVAAASSANSPADTTGGMCASLPMNVKQMKPLLNRNLVTMAA
jgi:hypothetical protein